MTLNVMYCSDNNYAPFAGVSIYSLLKSNRDIEVINVYYIGQDVSKDNLSLLSQTVSDFGEGRNFIFIDGADAIERLKKMPVQTYRGNYTTNLRLFFEEYISEDAETLLYLDCDTIIVDSLRELLVLDFGGKPAAAVLESIVGNYRRIIGLSDTDPYFNAGIMFISVPNWKSQKCTEKLFELMSDPTKSGINPDQDYLNNLLKDNFVILPPAYNFQPFHTAYSWKNYWRFYKSPAYYTEQEVSASAEKPVIYHTYRFLGQFPWHENSLHPLTKLWLEEKNESRFRDIPPVANRGGIFKVERRLYRILPNRSFLRIFKTHQVRTYKKSTRELKKKLNVQR